MNKLALVMIWLAVLLAGCGGSLRGDASAGPNPGGGFFRTTSRNWQKSAARQCYRSRAALAGDSSLEQRRFELSVPP